MITLLMFLSFVITILHFILLLIRFSMNAQHIEIDCHLVRQKLKTSLISTHHIASADQSADLFNKALSSSQLLWLLSKLGVVTTNLRGDVDTTQADQDYR